MSMPDSFVFSVSVSFMNAWPPPNSFVNVTEKLSLITLNASSNLIRETSSISLIEACVFSIESNKSFRWPSINVWRSAVSVYSSSAIMFTGPIASSRCFSARDSSSSDTSASPSMRTIVPSSRSTVATTARSFRQVASICSMSEASFAARAVSPARCSRNASVSCRKVLSR